MMKRIVILTIIAAIIATAVPLHSITRALRRDDRGTGLLRLDEDFPVAEFVNGHELSARAAILVSADTGKALLEHNADDTLPMASTTKIMTALVAIENASLDTNITVTDEAVGVEGSSIYLCEGEMLTLEELLYALLLESANDAAVAIAIGVGGSVESFVQLMNARACSLGLTQTSFENPHGLDGDKHYTTARELAVIAKVALENEELARIFATPKMYIRFERDGITTERLLVNHNRMLRLYDGAIGVKTGYTKKSGRCLVSCARRNGMTFIAVTLDAPDDWQDHAMMLDFGFESYENAELCSKLEISEILSVTGGAEEYVTVCNPDACYAVLPRQRGEITHRIELKRFEHAPIEKGEVLGRVVFLCEGVVIGQTPLVAAYGISAKDDIRRGFFGWISSLFNRQ